MLPFYLDKLFKEKIEGTALPQAQGLKLVFHAPQEGRNIFDAELEEMVLAWNMLEKLEIHRGLMRTHLEITVTTSDPFPRQLRPRDNKLRLEIRRRDRDVLDKFESDVAGFRSGQLTDDTDEFIDDMRDFLDRM